MKRNKSSKTAFDLMRHYELKKFLEGKILHLTPAPNVFNPMQAYRVVYSGRSEGYLTLQYNAS